MLVDPVVQEAVVRRRQHPVDAATVSDLYLLLSFSALEISRRFEAVGWSTTPHEAVSDYHFDLHHFCSCSFASEKDYLGDSCYDFGYGYEGPRCGYGYDSCYEGGYEGESDSGRSFG